MENERLETLLCNAIVILEDNGYLPEDVRLALGMSEEEYNKIMEV